jgi:hypothetical protein
MKDAAFIQLFMAVVSSQKSVVKEYHNVYLDHTVGARGASPLRKLTINVVNGHFETSLQSCR